MHNPPEFPQPPPELPEGSTSLPPLDTWWGVEPQTRHPLSPIQSEGPLPPVLGTDELLPPPVTPPVTPPNPPSLQMVEWESEIAKYSPEVQEVIRVYFPRIWNQHSIHTGVVIQTIPALLDHIKAAAKADAKLVKMAERACARHNAGKSEGDIRYSNEFTAWQNECQMRNAWIEGKAAEWRKRVAERTTAISKLNEYVEAARLDYQNAKATPPPPRPDRKE